LFHGKRNLGLAPLIFGLHSFGGRSVSFICHWHSTPSIETDLQLDMYSAEELPKSDKGVDHGQAQEAIKSTKARKTAKRKRS
jgi:hypothetical protein